MATNFLEASGTNGFIATPFNLMSSEMNGLTNAGTTLSSAGGSSGVFSQTNYGSAIWCEVYWVTPATARRRWRPSGYISGWFLFSPDGGSTFEKYVSGTAPPRTPDFIIPLLYIAAYGTSAVAQASGLVRVPWWSHKVAIQNNSGATFSAQNDNLIKAAPVAVQY